MINTQYQVLNEITVRSSALLYNYTYFATQNPQARIAPVLKSNAYGHGLSLVAGYLDWAIAAPFFCVDSLYEAYELHKSGIKSDIFIMGYTHPANYQVWKSLPFIFAASDTETLITLNEHQPGARVHLKLDTGMHRLGFTPDELAELIVTLRNCPNLVIEGVFSHLSQADEPSKITYTKAQIALFKQMTSSLEAAGYHFTWRHIAATAGAQTIRDPYFNLIRLGLGLYGYSPFGGHTNEGRLERLVLKPALSLTTRIAKIKELVKGDKVGYGGTYVAKQKETIAILPLGYNEGVPRELSNRGSFYVSSGAACPIVGRVCMNMTTIKLPRGSRVKAGDLVTFDDIDHVAKSLGTISHAILTGLHPSIRRTLV